jgi:hypothetical protein
MYLEFVVFRVDASCSVVVGYQGFGEPCSLHLQGLCTGTALRNFGNQQPHYTKHRPTTPRIVILTAVKTSDLAYKPVPTEVDPCDFMFHTVHVLHFAVSSQDTRTARVSRPSLSKQKTFIWFALASVCRSVSGYVRGRQTFLLGGRMWLPHKESSAVQKGLNSSAFKSLAPARHTLQMYEPTHKNRIINDYFGHAGLRAGRWGF